MATYPRELTLFLWPSMVEGQPQGDTEPTEERGTSLNDDPTRSLRKISVAIL